jgi:hypothetical protein
VTQIGTGSAIAVISTVISPVSDHKKGGASRHRPSRDLANEIEA